MKKIAVLLFLLSCVAWSATSYADAKPMRIGPVSLYGALGTNGNKVVSIESGKQVMLRGMSLFWSDATGLGYYTDNAISWASNSLGIDVFRFAMGVQYYNSQGNPTEPLLSGYITNPDAMMSKLDMMVRAAIVNDVYIIVDWHSHRAESEQSSAVSFFRTASERYKGIPNIIWEVYNEPVNTDMGTIARYADAVIGAIRVNSPNLALVGTPRWSQMGSCGGVNKDNVAYVFHFYAGSHSVNGYSGNVTSCMNGGNAVFISEWGTTDADGSGSVNSSESNNWISFMERNRISNCNWSLRHDKVDDKTEASALFSGNKVLASVQDLEAAEFSTSGKIVSKYLKDNRSSWVDSLTYGARNGACKFDHVVMSIADGSLSGKANGSCSYTSSDESVVVIENGVIKAKSAGVAVLTGNDNTKTVVQVTPLPSQNIYLYEITCRLNDACTGETYANLSNSGSVHEKKISVAKTDEGAEVTVTSDNPDVIEVYKKTCSNSSFCYGVDRNNQIWIANFKSLGTANIHVTAPAVTGYAALDTVLEFSYAKAVPKLNNKIFYTRRVELNSETEMFMETIGGKTIEYTLSDPTLASIDGKNLVTGDTPGELFITAEAPEGDYYEALSTSITVYIGMDPETQGIAKKGSLESGVVGKVYGDKLFVNSRNTGIVRVQVFDLLGKCMFKSAENVGATSTMAVDLKSLPRGRYVIKAEQNSQATYLQWNKK